MFAFQKLHIRKRRLLADFSLIWCSSPAISLPVEAHNMADT
jgi:hypothetical protein